MLNKRGGAEVEVYFKIFALVMTSIIFIMLLIWVKSSTKDTYFEKSYLAKDLSLLTDTILAGPGNIGYTYYFDKVDISEFNYELRDKAFIVTEAGKGSPIYFVYAEDGFRSGEIKASLPEPKQLQFSLAGNEFEIGKNLKPLYNKLVCRGIETQDQEWTEKKIVITAERDAELKIQIKDKVDFYKLNFKTDYTSGETIDLLIKIIKNENTNGTIKAYVNPKTIEKSSKLACLIINRLYDKHKDAIKGSAIIPTKSKMPEVTGVLLEISSDLLESSYISEIYSGIEDYFTK